MVKPPLRTKSIGFKVSEEEYAQLETAAQATDGRSGSGAARRSCGEGRQRRSGPGRDHRSALAAGERVGACGGGREGDAGEVQPTAGSNRRNEAPARRQIAAAGERESAARKTQRREAAISLFSAGECTERGSRVKGLRFAPMNAKNRAPLTRPPLRSVCFQPSKKCEKEMGAGGAARKAG